METTGKGFKMSKTQKVLAIAGGVLLTAGLGWLALRPKDASAAMLPEEDGNVVTPNPGNNVVITPHASTPVSDFVNNIVGGRNDNYPLKKGSKGDRVKALQNALSNNVGCRNILSARGIALPVADGDFGSKTENALRACYNVSQVNEALLKSIILKTAPLASASAGAGSGSGRLTAEGFYS